MLLYGVAGLVALFELGVTWVALHPHVPADYRAYYLDRTTTCLNEPVAGTYSAGTEIPFRSGYEHAIAPLRVCGWEGPAGDGLHAVGESARLRFRLDGFVRNRTLTLEMVAVDFAGPRGQPVAVTANGRKVGTVRVLPGTPQRFTLPLPDTVPAADATVDVELGFPEAILVDPTDSNTRKRSIKLSAARVG
jgi:hypothetical protein